MQKSINGVAPPLNTISKILFSKAYSASFADEKCGPPAVNTACGFIFLHNDAISKAMPYPLVQQDMPITSASYFFKNFSSFCS